MWRLDSLWRHLSVVQTKESKSREVDLTNCL